MPLPAMSAAAAAEAAMLRSPDFIFIPPVLSRWPLVQNDARKSVGPRQRCCVICPKFTLDCQLPTIYTVGWRPSRGGRGDKLEGLPGEERTAQHGGDGPT